MALTLANNVGALNAQHNLNRSSTSLSKSIERLSSGFKINRGADGPAALVISEKQRAQIAGLKTAIDNTEKAASVVQTAEGALNEINSLLVKVRGLALDSANSGANFDDALAANQAEITNALDTINRISENTQFASKKLLNGSAGVTGAAADTDVTVTATGSSAVEGTYAATVTTAAEKAQVVAGTANTGASTETETLTINGTNITIASGSTQDDAITAINAVSDTTGVVADKTDSDELRLTTSEYGSAATISVVSDLAASGTNSGIGGAAVTAVATAGSAHAATLTANETLAITANGATTNIALTAGDDIDDVIGKINAETATTGIVADDNGGSLRFTSNLVGSDGDFSIVSDLGAANQTGVSTTAVTGTGTDSTPETDEGVDIAGTLGSETGTGVGNTLTFSTGDVSGVSLSFGADSTDTDGKNSVTGGQGNLEVTDNSLQFQIGANQNQTASIAIANVNSSALGQNVDGNQFSALSEIDVTSAAKSQDALGVIDAAIDQISTLRGDLGAFQQNTLESTANNLRATLENTVNAESVIRDTDFASEIENFTKQQVLVQAGTNVLRNATQSSQLVLGLLG